MKKLTFLVAALFATTLAFAGITVLDETFASGQGEFTIEYVEEYDVSKYIWSANTSYGCMSARAYASEAWLISPSFDLTSCTSATLTFDHAVYSSLGTVSGEFQVYYAVSPSATFDASEWTNVTIPTYPVLTAGSRVFVSSGEISLPTNATKIAFRYKSTTGADADTWLVKNVKIADYEAFYVFKSNGTMLEFAISKVDSISLVKPDRHAWVDLGLPSGTKWATCNVGATSPEKYGNYYAWGETTTKSDYSWDTYKYGSAKNALTKYCNDISYGNDGFTDDLTTLEAADDAATANWGSAWRMPTKDEWRELVNNCTLEWTTLNGVKGYLVYSPNGNSIFLPAAGSRGGDDLHGAGYDSDYWSSSLYTDQPSDAYSASIYQYLGATNVYVSDYDRCVGLPVRPVCK